MENFLVSRIPVDITRKVFTLFNIQDMDTQKQLISSVIEKMDQTIDRDLFESRLIEAVIAYHKSL